MHDRQPDDFEGIHFIPYGRQWIDEDDISAVVDVLRSDWLTTGPKVAEFEDAFAGYTGARFAVAVSSGTAALHIACLAAGVGPGDEVITSPVSFVATANCALYAGARPIFVDIDPMTFNLDPYDLETRLKQSKTGHRPRAVIPVHFGGLPCDIEKIHRIAAEFDLLVIEDACHALGARYRNRSGFIRQESREDGWVKVGGCTHSDMCVFSFHPVKHITTGEGGMVTTNDESLHERLLLLRNHGITRDPDKFVDSGSTLHDSGHIPPWYYEMQTLGYNYRITDIQCALGRSQLRKIQAFVKRRRFIAERYSRLLKDLPGIRCQVEPEGYESSRHLYTLCVDEGAGLSRDDLMRRLRERGVGTQVHYIPIYRQPFYQRAGLGEGSWPNAEDFFRRCLSVPIFPKMSGGDIDRVLNALKEAGGRVR